MRTTTEPPTRIRVGLAARAPSAYAPSPTSARCSPRPTRRPWFFAVCFNHRYAEPLRRVAALQLALAAIESAETGQRVGVPDPRGS